MVSVPSSAPAWARQFADDVDAALRPRGSPAVLAQFSKTDLPDAARWVGAWIFVHDATGGPVPAFSNGVAWLRADTSAVIS